MLIVFWLAQTISLRHLSSDIKSYRWATGQQIFKMSAVPQPFTTVVLGKAATNEIINSTKRPML